MNQLHLEPCGKHLMEERPDVQNIDLMNLAGFCRNCLSRWFQEAAKENGIDLSKEEAREIFYGMPMDEWKTKYQLEVNSETEAKFQKAFSRKCKIHRLKTLIKNIFY